MVLPFSTALTLLFSIPAVVLSVLSASRKSVVRCLQQPLILLSLALFTWLYLSSLWSIAPRDELLEALSKYRRLIYIPLFLIVLYEIDSEKWNFAPVKFFLVGCTFVLIGSLFTTLGLTEFLLGPERSPGSGWEVLTHNGKALFYIGPIENPTFGRNHITTTLFLVLLFNGLFYMSGLRSGRLRYVYLLFACLAAFAIANMQSRGGYLLLATSLLCWTLIFARSINCSNNKFRILMLVIPAVLTIALLSSGKAEKRLTQAMQEIRLYIKDSNSDNSSVGGRLSFYTAGIGSVIDQPFMGYGAGSFAQIYVNSNNHGALHKLRNQPHSEIVNQLVQGGGVALCLYLAIFAYMIAISLRSGRLEVLIPVVLLLMYSVWNSTLWDLAEGHLFVLMVVTLTIMANMHDAKTSKGGQSARP